MKSINKIFSNKGGPDEYMQTRSAFTPQSEKVEEGQSLFESTRQLYATEAEDYFFYFITIQKENKTVITI